MRIQGFHHLAIKVREVERVAAFYRELLGLAEMARHRKPDGAVRSIWLALPEMGFLAIEVAEASASGPSDAGLFLIAFRIDRDERGQILAELARRGISVDHQTRWTVYFRDPEGNRVGLSHHPFDPLE
jgi:catechol-2,3-dioxygenase